MFLSRYDITPGVPFGAFASENSPADKQLLSSDVVLYLRNLKPLPVSPCSTPLEQLHLPEVVLPISL